MALFASFVAIDDIEKDFIANYRSQNEVNLTATKIRKEFRSFFRKRLLNQLHFMGVKDPLLHIKKGGIVGNDTISKVSSNFLGILI